MPRINCPKAYVVFISDKYQKILLKENSTIVDERPEEYEFKIQT
jgi:hypothetical protein